MAWNHHVTHRDFVAVVQALQATQKDKLGSESTSYVIQLIFKHVYRVVPTMWVDWYDSGFLSLRNKTFRSWRKVAAVFQNTVDYYYETAEPGNFDKETWVRNNYENLIPSSLSCFPAIQEPGFLG